MKPQSCDTFVVMGDKTSSRTTIFGKNSDRPNGEVQEVILREKQIYPENSKLKCTYIEIDQVTETCAVILSKPDWMWGAEMGANEHGVCIGNEAIWTKMDIDPTEKLLGMDLLRLGLERGNSAEEALRIICNLLEKYGQGGCCSNTNKGLSYHNSFLIADNKEAWVLETVDKYWAAERITTGHRNISNNLTIGTNIDLMSLNLKENLKDLGYWDGVSEFDFTKCLSEEDDDRSRQSCGQQLLQSLTKENNFSILDMFNGILRDTKSNISRGMDDGFPTMGSMASVLGPDRGSRPDCHWFTGTPDPTLSVFKPFIFTPNVKISSHIQCKEKGVPHLLYRRHSGFIGKNSQPLKTLREVEQKCVRETELFLDNFTVHRLPEVDELFNDCVESELKFY